MSGSENSSQKLLARVEAWRSESQKLIGLLVDRLDWEGFVVLIDLIFQRCGWNRTWLIEDCSPAEAKRVDFGVEQCGLRQKGYVVVLDSAQLAEIKRVMEKVYRNPNYDYLFFIFRCDEVKAEWVIPDKVMLWRRAEIIDRIQISGLGAWLIEETLSHLISPESSDGWS